MAVLHGTGKCSGTASWMEEFTMRDERFEETLTVTVKSGTGTAH